MARLADRLDSADIAKADPRSGVTPAIAARFDELLQHLSSTLEDERVLGLYLAGRCWADSGDAPAAAESARLDLEGAVLRGLLARFEDWASGLPIDDLCAASHRAAQHRGYLLSRRAASAHRLDPGQEQLASELKATGSSAWRRFHEQTLGRQEIRLADGRRVPLSGATALMASANTPAERRSVHEATGEALAAAAPVASACLNAIKGENLTLAVRRGHRDALEAALHVAHADRHLLDAVQGGVGVYLPLLHRFLRAKSRLISDGAPLPIWQLTPPAPRESRVEWDAATSLVHRALRRFSDDLGELVERALAQRWIDAQIRPRKRALGLCMPLRAGESRLMISFDGTLMSAKSLAHEFGHAYHYHALAQVPELLRSPPIHIQEAPSMVCESLFFQHLRSEAKTPHEELRVLDVELTTLVRTLATTHARFQFERALFERRAEGEVSVETLRAAERESGKAAYGPAIDGSSLHGLDWVSLPHYYLRDFDNWTYCCGRLLANRLLSDWRHGKLSGAEFTDMLRRVGDPDVARDIGKRLLDPGSQLASVEPVRTATERFEELATELGPVSAASGG